MRVEKVKVKTIVTLVVKLDEPYELIPVGSTLTFKVDSKDWREMHFHGDILMAKKLSNNRVRVVLEDVKANEIEQLNILLTSEEFK